jgi:hypothetical protein
MNIYEEPEFQALYFIDERVPISGKSKDLFQRIPSD